MGKDNTELINLMICRIDPPNAKVVIYVEEKEEKYLKRLGKKPWKIKEVTLIYFMLLYEHANFDIVNNSIKDYSQAWPLMDVVDTSDPKADLVSQEENKEFDALEDIFKEHINIKLYDVQGSYGLLEKKIKIPLQEDLEQFSEEQDLELFSKEEERK